jgi:hypothetical protein
MLLLLLAALRARLGFSRLNDDYWSVFTGSFSDGMSDVRKYCAANGIYASLYLDSQKDCSQILGELCEIANCVAVWNGQALDFYPLSEVSAVGGGYTYTPRTASGPLASFDNRHLVADENESPITIKQEGMQSVSNILDINYSYAGYDQADDPTTGMSSYPSYQSNNVRICDAEHVRLYGPMNGSPRGYDAYICDATTATTVGWPIMKRQRFADPYAVEFKLPATIASLLDPMDLITISDASMFGGTLPSNVYTTGPTTQDVRLTSLEEDKHGEWTISAERFMYGMSAPNAPSITGSTPNPPASQTESAGNVNTPYFFEPTAALAQALGMQQTNGLGIAVRCSAANYGGCQVWVSTNGGTSYTQIGSIALQPAMGDLTSSYPSHINPDASNTIAVDLTWSLGELQSYTIAQQDQLNSIALIDGGGTGSASGYTTTIPYEIVAYGSVTLTSAHKYNLTPTNLRGQLGSVPAAHSSSAVFVDLSDSSLIFKTTIPSGSILGNTLYFKFPSYNQYGQAIQDLSFCTAYTFTPTGQTNPAGTVGPSGQYTISPNPCLYQGQTGGWPGVDSSSTTWTNTNNVYWPSITVQYQSGSVTYPSNDSGSSAFTGSGQTKYVTIYDPGKAGGSQPIHVDSTNTNATTPGYVYLGQITSQASGGQGGSGGSSGTGGPTNPGGDYVISVNGVQVV